MTTGELERDDLAAASGRRAATKVSEITAYFWITTVLTTGVGEATSDYLGRVLGTPIAVTVGRTALVVALVVPFTGPRYIATILAFVAYLALTRKDVDPVNPA